MKRIAPLLLIAAMACRQESKPTFDRAAYERDIAQYRKTRVERLTRPDGWLSVVALLPLQEGKNKVAIPSRPPKDAQITLQQGRVTLDPDSSFTIDNKPVTAPVELHNDTEDAGYTIVHYGPISFFIHKVGDHFGVRVKDPDSERRKNFKGIDTFPTDPKYRVEARFEPYNPPKHIPMPNVSGITTDEISPGALVFMLDGKEFRIDPILEQGTKDYFIIIKDATSGRETYGAARYLYASPPDAGGKTIVDFNKAYNPPCAFTPYATCPLPPPQNRLLIPIEAGEKKYAGGHE
jgi:uncharacterized protein (DUF1684 family)